MTHSIKSPDSFHFVCDHLAVHDHNRSLLDPNFIAAGHFGFADCLSRKTG